MTFPDPVEKAGAVDSAVKPDPGSPPPTGARPEPGNRFGREPGAGQVHPPAGQEAQPETAPHAAPEQQQESAEDPGAVLTRERDQYLAALQRTQADFENYRKRIARQQQEQSARAAADLVGKLLPVLDTLDLAEAHLNESLDVSEDGKALRASRSMLNDILAKEGLERVDQAGVPFDPTCHDAVAHSEAEDGDDGGTVVEEVLRSGYRWKGQPLRPAMVRVRG
jgi:molecular chaperone GrpE